jgi:poly-gamma-glutamate biosynthesis protein PgsC/CapC
MLIQAIGTGIFISFLFTELTGLLAGGLIVPGYFAIFWDQPARILMTFGVALLSFLVVSVLSNFIVIYSRRRFMASVLSGYILGWLLATYFIDFIPFQTDVRVIGYIVPGLIANDMIKQGIMKTIISAAVVTVIVRLLLLLMI